MSLEGTREGKLTGAGRRKFLGVDRSGRGRKFKIVLSVRLALSVT